MDRPVGENDEVATCFRDGKVTLRKTRRLRGFTQAIYEFGYQGIRKGDFVIHGMDAFAGAVGVSVSNGKGTPAYAVCQPKTGVNAHDYAFIIREMARSQWILALSRGIRERSTDFRYDTFGGQRVPLPPPPEQAAMVRFLDYANGRLERAIRANRKVITCEELKRFKMAIPPTPEQEALLKHVQTETAQLDPTITRLEREIGLLLEYRTRLVADVVTGKLDVRPLSACLAQAGAARQLPEEGGEQPPEPEPSDGLDGSDLSGEGREE